MNWHFKPKVPDEFVGQFPEYSPIVLQLLHDRGLETQKQIDEFFNPDYEQDLHDPFLMLGMKEAASGILKAIKAKKKIVVFGDYDADGVCGAVILKTVFEKLGAQEVDVYIPNRMIEGYGLNEEAIKKAAASGARLIVTVDCGINDSEEIKLAKTLGMKVIVIDHHVVGKKLPSAEVVVDPFQKGDKYPFKELAGAGVAYKLVQALLKIAKDKTIVVGWEKWLLDLVALATVADCMPLLGENRTLVRYGLIVLAQTKRMGLVELMKIARLEPVFEASTLKTNLDAYSLGFILAPRINAAGRIEHASFAFDLLCSQDPEKAKIAAQKIDEFNRKRQTVTEGIMAEIEERIKNSADFKNEAVIVEVSEKWSAGVIGLVAGRLADRYHKPAFVFIREDQTSRGSARSIPVFNIIEAIKDCAELLKEFGGHSGSAGLKIENSKFEDFKKKINQCARERLKDEDLVASIEADLEVEPAQINWALFDDLVRFEPFGKGNEQPVFVVRDLVVQNCRAVGANSKHLKLELKTDKMEGKIFKAIGFRLANGNGHLKPGDRIDLAFEFIIDEWNGNRDLQLKIVDIKKI